MAARKMREAVSRSAAGGATLTLVLLALLLATAPRVVAVPPCSTLVHADPPRSVRASAEESLRAFSAEAAARIPDAVGHQLARWQAHTTAAAAAVAVETTPTRSTFRVMTGVEVTAEYVVVPFGDGWGVSEGWISMPAAFCDEIRQSAP